MGAGNRIDFFYSKLSRVLFFLIIHLGFALFLSGGLKAEDDLSDILDGILKRYGNLPGLEVSYKREIITGSMALMDEEIASDPAKGRMFFKPSGFIMIQQDSPQKELVTTDGEMLWWYIPKKKIVYRYPSDRLGKELTLLGDLLGGLDRVSEGFDVMQSDLVSESSYHLQLYPNPKWQEIDFIDLIIRKGDYDIKTVEIHNYLGNITRFIMGDYIVRDNLDSGFFHLEVPEDVKVIDE